MENNERIGRCDKCRHCKIFNETSVYGICVRARCTLYETSRVKGRIIRQHFVDKNSVEIVEGELERLMSPHWCPKGK